MITPPRTTENLSEGQATAPLPGLLARLLCERLKTARPGALPEHLQRWFDRSLLYLSQNGYSAELAGPPDAHAGARWRDLWKEWEGLRARLRVDARSSAMVDALDAIVPALPDILEGRVSADELLPPDFSVVRIVDPADPDAEQRCEGAIYEFVNDYLEERIRTDPADGVRILDLGREGRMPRDEIGHLLRLYGGSIREYRFGCRSANEAGVAAALGDTFATFRFDIEPPLIAQGISPDRYDVVIASCALHRANDVRSALRRIKPVLKRNGILILGEIGAFDLAAHLTIGLMPYWWDYQDGERRLEGSRALGMTAWLDLLTSEGFRDAFALVQPGPGLGRHVILAESDGIAASHAESVSSPADRAPLSPPHEDGAQDPRNGSALAEPASEASILQAIEQLVRASLIKGLGLEPEEVRNDGNFEEYGLESLAAVRIIKDIAAELSIPLPATLMFDFNTVENLSRHLLDAHSDAARARFMPSSTPVRETIDPIARPESGHEAAIAVGEKVRKLLIDRPGAIEDIRIVSEDLPVLGPRDVRVAVRAFALNFGDLLCVKGLYPTMPPYPFTPGMEVSGVVTACGPEVTAVKPGNAVVAMTGAAFGGHATFVTCAEHQLWPKPETLSFEEACSLPIAGITMLEAFRRAQLKRGERILIQTAAGGAGMVAVQLARHLGAEIFATAGTPEKTAYLAQSGAHHCINYKQTDFEVEISRQTGGRGVDVVINTLAGDAIQKGLKCLSPGGRYIELAMTGLKGARAIDLSVLDNNQTFHSLDLRKQVSGAPERMADLYAELGAWIEKGVIRPVLSEVVPFEEVDRAYRLLEERRNIGKVVVQVPAVAELPGVGRKGCWHSPEVVRRPQGDMPVRREPIAIVGMSGRFPRSRDLDALWTHLANGADLTEQVSRWDLSLKGTGGPGEWRGGFLAEIDKFDAAFFNITDIEALYMDPQQRVFLEEAWNALESAGYVGASIDGRSCGVYVGAASVDYDSLFDGDAPPQAFWGNVGSIIPARIAYHLNLRGPAVAVDTACSSSLVAIHMACQSLWLGEVEMALAGGVFLQPGPSFFQQSIAANMLSPTGRCHAFDDRADGFVPGEGAGALVLKRLRDAVADGDHIHGLIRGIGVNQDGKTSGITAPSGHAQTLLEKRVYAEFGIDPDTIQLVEAHGTGTKLGDPIEYRALSDAFETGAARRNPCAIGSIKTNLGHAVTAAGVAGVLKVLLAIRHGKIPPSIHFESGNANIDFGNSPFFVNTELRDWPAAPERSRLAAVSSFGFSGTNAHAVVEEPPALRREHARRPGYLVVLSARTQEQLRAQAEQLLQWSADRRAIDFGDLSFTLSQGRRHFEHRLALAASSIEDMRRRLGEWLSAASPAGLFVGTVLARSAVERARTAELAHQYVAEANMTSGEETCLDRLRAIADLFVQGTEIEFADLFTDGDYGRIPLPTYPYSRKSFWVGKNHPDERPIVMADREERFVADPASVEYLTREWVPAAIETVALVPLCQRHWVFLDPGMAALQPRLSALLPNADVDLLPEGGSAAGRLAASVVAIVARTDASLKAKQGGSLLVQVVGSAARNEPDWRYALSGLFRSAQLENPRLTGQVIGLEGEAGGTAEALATILRDNSNVLSDAEILYRADDARYVTRLESRAAPRDDVELPWKEGGVYLITGGGGALGRIFAREIAARCGSASVILTGRSARHAELDRTLAELRASGLSVEYRAVDAGDRSAVEALVGDVRRSHGKLDGIIHAAGVTRDNFLIRKDRGEFMEVLAPKAAGVEHLDHATRDLPLDFFVLFSSISAVFGNGGQTDYAAANAFLDRFAEHRSRLTAEGKRSGRTASIGWPLWADGGLGKGAALRADFAEAGMLPLETHLGLRAFYTALASARAHTIVLRGAASAAIAVKSPVAEPAASARSGNAAGRDCGALEADLWNRLVALMRTVTLLAPERFDSDATFESFGIDSTMIMQLNVRLARIFNGLPQTLLFEYSTLRELRDYLLREHPDACVAWCDRGAARPPAVSMVPEGTGPRERAVLKFPQPSRSRPGPAERSGIAIIGLSGTYPQAPDLDRFWSNLVAGRDCVTEIIPERWSSTHHCDDPDLARRSGKSYCKVGAFIQGFANFDPLFFNIAPTEAMSMDPQERLFLQECWHAMEDAGYTREALRTKHDARVGVFAGVSKTGYELYGPEMWRNGEEIHLRTSFASVANRVSYLLDLRGPSIAVDTMCSSSLTAIHQACESLLRNECALAFAGGVNLYLHPETYATLCAAGMLSPTGACKSFGAGSDGFVPGEGAGAILLKRLEDAIADGDNIHSVIRASAINHGGRSHGYTVPNARAQRELIQSTLERAGVSARDIDYVEAHGTGTLLGDPVEIEALSQAFAPDTQERQYCAIGSIKSNIGHLEAAAGIAGLTKVVLQMKHGMLVPSLHADALNGNIRFEQTQFAVQRELAEWPAPDAAERERLACVSSFGAGGANAHLVVEAWRDARERVSAARSGPAHILLSARSEERLRAYAARVAEWLEARLSADVDLHDLAHTLKIGREVLSCRLALEVESIEELAHKLQRFVREGAADVRVYHADSAAEKDRLAGMLGDEDPRQLAGSLIERGAWSRLLDLWTRGLAVDWSQLDPAVSRRRISAPGYPFAEERYWPRAAMSDVSRPVPVDDGICLLSPVWERQPSVPALDADHREIVALIVGEGGSIPDLAPPGHSLRLASDASIEDYAGALSACGDLTEFLWYAPPSRIAPLHDDALLDATRDCVRPFFRFVKALLRLGFGARGVGLTVVTRNGVATAASELADPAHAALQGLIGSLAKEYSNWRIRAVDIDEHTDPSPSLLLAVPPDPLGEITAIRDGRWFRQRLVRGAASTQGDLPYRRGGVYVLIGGAGHVGGVLSEQLVRDHQAQIVWIGRREADSAIRSAIDRLAKLGPPPLYIRADASDRAALEGAYHRIVETYGPINGLVHSAIVLDDVSVAGMDEERLFAVLAAKADVCVRMAQVFQREALDFVLFFSSLQSFGRLAGQGNYSAACLFADAFAHRLRAAWRMPVKIMNWGSWDVVDGKATSPLIAATMENAGVGVLSADDAAAGIALLLAGPFDQLGYFRSSAGTIADRTAANPAQHRVRPPLPASDTSSDHGTPVVAHADLRGHVRDTLIDQLRQALNLASQPIASDDPLAVYGLDSITGLSFITLVNAALDVELDITAIFDHPSIGALTEHISSRLGGEQLIAEPRAEPSVIASIAPSSMPEVRSEPEPTPPAAALATLERIAVVGLSARYSQAGDAQALWEHLARGADLVGQATRWEAISGDIAEGGPFGKHGGFLDGIEDFDPLFFGISKAEARYMDPQQRIFLEEAWHALEDAGYAGASMKGQRCGVYVGHNRSDYHRLFPEDVPPQALWGNAPSIVSARIAYHLDLQGPAITIDTACSSSLVAIHLACQALRSGEVDTALAGGVQVFCTPGFHAAAGKAGMLSPTGRCHTFDDRADGFVPAEGAGVLVLKRLSDALACRDHIYGVILGSATNQDGATNGITAPSGLAQERLERQAYREAGVRPRDIALVEAHGTGTKLGDPIEFGALANVFREDTPDRAFCALGSIKTNIGHALAASGVAGALKALLALRHAQIPPSIHFETGNARIRFDDSPFYVPRELVPWPCQTGRPRLAAVSSFGFSGTNAHMIFGEAPSPAARLHGRPHHLIVLSAKRAEQLRQLAERVRDHCRTMDGDCGDLSFTLAVGRQHFAHRIALVVEDIATLDAALSEWLGQGQLPGGFVAGLREREIQEREHEVALATSAVRACRGSEDQPARYREALLRLAQLHVQGYPLPLHELFADGDFGRIPLPGYPFRREHCWVEQAGRMPPLPESPLRPASPPSPATEQGYRFSVTLEPDDARIRGHRQGGRRAVPGVTCLEIVLKALRESSGFEEEVYLTNIVWLRPILLDDGPVSLTVDVRVDGATWKFEVRRSAVDSAVYCRGDARPCGEREAAAISLEAARAACGRRTLTCDQARDMLAGAGFAVTADEQIIESIYLGDDGATIRFRDPGMSFGAGQDAALHPAFLHAALQGWAAARVADGEACTRAAPIPFALDALTAGHMTRAVAWASIRASERAQTNVLDIDFYDEAGRAGARFRGLTLRQPSPGDPTGTPRAPAPSALSNYARTDGESAPALMTLVPHWTSASATSRSEPVGVGTTMVFARSDRAVGWCRSDLSAAGTVIISAGTTTAAIADALREIRAIDRIVYCLLDDGDGDGNGSRLAEGRAAIDLFRMAKALLLCGHETAALELVVVTQNGVAVRSGDSAIADQAAVHGVVGCLAKELPNWRVKVADIISGDAVRLADVLRLPPDPDGNVLAFRDGQWLRQGFVDCPMDEAGDSGFRRGGVYVVLGGAGALGEVLSEHLIRHYAAQVVWVGRRALDSEIQHKIDRLGRFGPVPQYICADARDRAGFRRILDTVARRHPFIDGLVHSAIVLSGSDVAHMTEESFSDVFSAKAVICDNIAELCVPGSIGLVLLFSSIQSLQKTPRQANYAAGCAYKDAKAGLVAERLGCPVKIVNWGYWGSVGRAAKLNAFQNWLKQAGIGSIEPAEGMAFLDRFLASPVRQAAYVKLLHGGRLRGITIDGDGPVADLPNHSSVFNAPLKGVSHERASAILAEVAQYPTDAFETIIGRLLCMQMESLGVLDQDRIDSIQAWKAAGIIDLYQPWIAETLRILARLGYLDRDGATYRRAGSIPLAGASLWQAWEDGKAAWRNYPQVEPLTLLIDATLRNLPDILTGRAAATEIIFPGSSLRLVEPLYKGNPIADYFNHAAADSLVDYLRERLGREPDARIRILEVGAGTGGTTSVLIDRIRSFARHIEDYRYTDLSKVFLIHAQAEYAPRAPYLSCAIFDVEKPPEDQAIPRDHFDIVIAANVLHATRDMRRTLANVRACMKPDGLLLLNEMSANGIFSHLTFGLLKGWWLSEDLDLRIEGSPVIAQKTWRSVLAETGFGAIHFPTEETAHLGQQIVVAQRSEKPGREEEPHADASGVPAPIVEVEAAPAGRLAVRQSGVQNGIRQAIVEEVSQALEIEPDSIDPDVSFADYGVDSIIAVATVDRLNDRLGADLTSTSLFEHSCVNLLVEHIVARQQAGPAIAATVSPAHFVPGEETAKLPAAAPAPESRAARAEDGPTSADAVAPQSAVGPPAFAHTDTQPSLIEPIAIVGASGRFGSADSLSDLWQSLAAGRERVAPVTRWDIAECYGVPEGSEGYCWRGGFLNDIDRFDPAFFNISGIEACYMDPQQRLFLEEAWRALEDGGYAGPAIEGRRCGVYAGQNGEDYRALCTGAVPPQAMWGNAGAVLSARISYYLNLKGPAITIDTACSSSLVAVHLACQSLRLREIDMALAGGVAVRCTSEFYKAAGVAGMLSPSGHCYAFDERADGFVPGEGVGVILLKRLSDALADGDQIHAVIKGSCLNQDGTTNGITAPNAASQEQLELEVYERTQTHPEQIQLVEAHGTGTRLGDPIEHEALTRAFRKHTQKKGFCALGSIKANIGHATAAAGVASVMKVILALRHGKIPPSPNFVAPNPLLAMDDSPFYVNTDLRDWPRPPGGRRCAAISAFGISGTNAHLIMEEGPVVTRPVDRAPFHLVVVSARSKDQLHSLLDTVLSECEQRPTIDCADVSYTLLMGRKHLRHRIALAVRDTAHLVKAGRQYLKSGKAPSVYSSAAFSNAPERGSLMAEFGNRCLRECAEGASGEDCLTRLQAVADLFVQGHPLDFGALFAGRSPRRISLPTYPFARERYWASDASASAPALSTVVESVWEGSEVDPPAVEPATGEAPALSGRDVFAAISRFLVEELRIPDGKICGAEDIQSYGMDSLMSMRLARRLERDFEVALTSSDTLQCRTIDELTQLVAGRLDRQSPAVILGAPPGDEAPVSEAERRAIEVLDRFNRGDLDLDQTEAMLKEIALA